LALRELILCTGYDNAREETPGGVPYIVFDTQAPLDEAALTRLSRLSFAYALFLVHENKTLTPLDKNSAYRLSDDISMMLKYTGKTHELFTRFMLNLAISYVRGPHQALRMLDPLCGKGTSLFEGLMLGHHAMGIEIDEKLAYEAVVFFRKYLETAKIKHKNHTEKIGGQDASGKRFTATRHQVTLTRDKLDFEVIAGNTAFANTYFKKNSFHVIVGDLPYGVQHKSGKSTTRNAMGLLTEALPAWLKILKPGGVMVLAWNLFLIPRAQMEALFARHGLHMPEETKDGFAHRVDQAINRDLIVGVKPS
jgi:tRNA G10  N-methylase Trm11